MTGDDARAELLRTLAERAVHDRVHRLSVGALVVRDGRALLLRRPGSSLHDLPGGLVGDGEPVLDAVDRWLVAQTGLEPRSVAGYVGSFDTVSPSGRPARQHNFVVTAGPGEPRPDPARHEAAVWVGRDGIAGGGAASAVMGLLRAVLGARRHRDPCRVLPGLRRLLRLALPAEDLVVVGSAPMVLHGLREAAGDLDVLARGRAWAKAVTLGPLGRPRSGVGNRIELDHGRIELFDAWAPGTWDVGELVARADVVEGVRFARLEDVLAWKLVAGRPKDLLDAERIRAHLAIRSRGPAADGGEARPAAELRS